MESTVEEAPPIQQPPIEPPQSKAGKLYDGLVASGFSQQILGDKNKFLQDVQDPIKANKLYSGLRASGYGEDVLGNMTDFRNNLQLPKKASGNGGGNTPLPSLGGGIPNLTSSVNTNVPSAFTPIANPQLRQQLQQQQADAISKQQQQFQSAQGAYQSAHTPDENAQMNYATQQPASTDEVKQYVAPTLSQKAGYELKSIAGSLNKGIANMVIAPLYQYGNKIGLVSDDEKARVLNQVSNSSKETFGLDPHNLQDNGNVVHNAINQFAFMAPALITAEGTGGASFGLQTAGQASATVNQMKQNGVQFDNHSDDLFILGSGIIGTALGRGSMGKIFNSLGSSAKSNVVSALTADAIKELADKGEQATADDITKTFLSKSQTFADKVGQTGLSALSQYAKVGTELSAANAATYGTKKLANAVSGNEPFEDTTGSDFVQGVEQPFGLDKPANGNPLTAIGNMASSPAGVFGAIGGAHEGLDMLGHDPNPVIENLQSDNSPENVQSIKQQLVQHAQDKGWSDEETQKAQGAVDLLSSTVAKLPKGLSAEKVQKGVSIIMGRNELQDQLQQLQDDRSKLDPSVANIPGQTEQLIQDKIDQANDKLRGLVSGNRTTYSKGLETNGEDGQFFKTVNGTKEEITPSRYDLEDMERDAKKKPELPLQEGENKDATTTGIEPENGVGQHQGITQGENIQPDGGEVREGEGGQASGGDSVVSGENTQPIDEENKIKVSEVIGKPITYHGEDATLEQDGQTVIAKIKDSNREYELGNVDDIGDKSIKDLGIEHQDSVVGTHENGNITVRDKEYVNNYSDPLSAINKDKDGNIVSVNLETPDGEKRTFRGDVAEDIAYQIHLKELNKNNEKFEQFAEGDKPTKSAIVATEDANTAEKATVADNAEVSRKPARTVEQPKVKAKNTPPEQLSFESHGAQIDAPNHSERPDTVNKVADESKEPANVATEPDGGTDVKKTILTKRAYEGDIQPEVKKYLEDKGLTRKSFSQEERSQQATDFINKFGEEAAHEAVKSGDVDGGMAASILAQLQIRNSRAMADFPEGSEERDTLAKKQADIIATLEKKGYLGGEFNGQLAHEYQNAELDYANVKKQVEDATKRPLTDAQDKKVKSLTDENQQLKKQVQDAEAKLIDETDKAFNAGKEAAKDETKTEKAKRVANKLRSLKINSVNDATLGIPVALYNGALETSATLIEGGGKLADAISAGIDHIKESDWYKSASASKQKQVENDFKKLVHGGSDSTDLPDLQERFVDKTDNKFTPDEARSIWGYIRKTYIDNGVTYRDAISKAATDLGLSWRQVSDAITSPKVKRASDEMWKRQYDLARNTNGIKNWIGEQTGDPIWRAIKKVSGVVRGEKVVGHGAIFVGTHAGMTLFDLPTANKTVKAFLNGWKFAYGKEADYQRSMEELKNSPNYLIAQRAGLKNNPDQINTEEYQKSQKFLGRLGLAGTRGFNAIKVLRQDLFDYSFNRLTPEERSDPEVAKSVAKIMNLATGATSAKIPDLINEVSFAGGMESSRWQKLFQSPAKAAATAYRAIVKPEQATTADRVFAKVWSRRVGTQLATYTTALLANAAIQNSINPKNKVNLTDPSKPDWGKFKFGTETIDPTSGMRSTVDFIYKLGKVAFDDKKNGDQRDKTAGKIVEGYARGKLAPLYSTIADQYAGDDFEGNVLPYRHDKPASYAHKLTWGEYAWQQAPLPVAEAAKVYYQSALEHGANKHLLKNVLKGIGTGLLTGATGVRANEYDANSPENKKKK